jgi:hypothetical protein
MNTPTVSARAHLLFLNLAATMANTGAADVPCANPAVVELIDAGMVTCTREADRSEVGGLAVITRHVALTEAGRRAALGHAEDSTRRAMGETPAGTPEWQALCDKRRELSHALASESATLAALRAVLPLAEHAAGQLRTIANAAQAVAGEHVADRAEAATAAVTAARLAIQDAEAAAEHVHCRVAYDVTLRAELGGRWASHSVRVMAECADDAQAEALRRLEAAGIVHGDVLHVRRA